MKCFYSDCESVQTQGGGVECRLQGNCTSFSPDPQTHFDRITESPEALAKYLDDTDVCTGGNAGDPDTCPARKNGILNFGLCRDCIINWLKQPCESKPGESETP